MAAAKYDFDIEQGSSFTISFTYKDSTNTVVNISNWCARIIMTTSDNQTITYSSGTTSSDYKMSLDGPTGKVTLLLPAITTNNFTFKTAKYDLELESDDVLYSGGGNYTNRILYGVITIVKRISNNSTILDC
jgi:hypothetical protein